MGQSTTSRGLKVGGQRALPIALVLVAMLAMLLPAERAEAWSYSAEPFVYDITYETLLGQEVVTTITVEVQGHYNRDLGLAEFSCSAQSPTAISASLTCFQGKGVGNPVTAGNLGSTVTAGPVVTAGRTSEICFVTDFIYPGTSERGQESDCTEAIPLPL